MQSASRADESGCVQSSGCIEGFFQEESGEGTSLGEVEQVEASSAGSYPCVGLECL